MRALGNHLSRPSRSICASLAALCLAWAAQLPSAVAVSPPGAALRMPPYVATETDVDERTRQLNDDSEKTLATKGIDSAWVQSLTLRGEPTEYSRENSNHFEYIGMPIGGIGAGQLYLGGDGKLWYWDIFNTKAMEDTHGERSHVVPYCRSDKDDRAQLYPRQGFCIRLDRNGKVLTKTLDRDGWEDITFRGRYPIGEVTYADKDFPLQVQLEAFSPFVPLDLESSNYPATVLNYTITNTSDQAVDGELIGWCENAVLIESRKSQPVSLRNRIDQRPNVTMVSCDASDSDSSSQENSPSLREARDFGSMALAVIAEPSDVVGAAAFSPPNGTLDRGVDIEESNGSEPPVGAVGRKFHLAPGESTDVRLVLAWYFPNIPGLPISTPSGRHYGARFDSAMAVAAEVAERWNDLTRETRLWRDTWYDSTLPYWFLDRTFANTSCLATNTSYLLHDGRFYGYEGVYHGHGTCTHVWGYAQAPGRLFPVIEQRLREMVDYKPGVGFDPGSGQIFHRSEHDHREYVDGHASVILRTYLVHQMQADGAFLQRVYPAAAKAMDFLVNKYDADRDGVLTGAQFNTLDAAWYGKITWLSLHYDAALLAAAAMADEMGDSVRAEEYRQIAQRGREYIESELFNGEYFFHEADAQHPESPGVYNGLEYSQLLGQSWAYQVGLGQILDPQKVTTHLESLWRYNFTTDVGPFRAKYTSGRWYAMPGEGGIIACTWPHGGDQALSLGNERFAAYLNECQPGYEWAVTSLMMWHHMPDHALAHARTMHDRYDGKKRNPWNEVEWGDHYSRSMASYGVFTAACGFEYDGPRGYIAFSPRITPHQFKAAFTSAKGWGSFSQRRTEATQSESLEVRWGELNLSCLAFDLPAGKTAKGVRVVAAGKEIPAEFQMRDNRVVVTLNQPAHVDANQELSIEITMT